MPGLHSPQRLHGTRTISRRAVLASAATTAMAIVLSACGSSATPPTTTAVGSPTQPVTTGAVTQSQAAATAAKPQTTTAASANPTPGVSGGAPAAPQATVPAGAKVVTFWIPWGQPERQKWVTDWGTKFHDQYPDHALKMEFVGFGNMRQRWIAASQAGQMPELLNVGFGELGAAFVAGAVERADDIVKDFGGNYFLEGPLAAWKYQGVYFGIPLYVFPRMLYYRQDLYTAKGLKPPSDWDTWYTA